MSKRIMFQYSSLTRMEERIKELIQTGWKLISRHSITNKEGKKEYLATFEPSDNE